MTQTFSGQKTAQRADEFGLLLDFLRARGVRSVLEIGTRHGDALHEFGKVVGPGGSVVGVDLVDGPWGHAESQANAERAVADLVENHHVDASMVFGDSRSAEVIAQARARGPFDFVFIDGDHTPKGVLADWKNYGELAPIVGFHDIDAAALGKKKAARYGVPRLFEELKALHPTVSIISPRRGMGIGLVLRA